MSQGSNTPESEQSLDWFQEWFNHPLYLEVYSHRDSDEAAQCINTILSISTLEQKDPASIAVLDIACGAGRHALELARLGFRVTGNDLSPYLLDEARKSAEINQLPLTLTCCDMRHIPANDAFNLVVQLFTSFGYFDQKEDDRLVLGKAYRALKSGGWYILDLINPIHLAKKLQPHSSRTIGELTLIEKRAFVDDRITKSITIVPPIGERVTFSESVRLYGKDEIVALLEKEGFSVKTLIGNYLGDAFKEEESPRMMLFCRKP